MSGYERALNEMYRALERRTLSDATEKFVAQAWCYGYMWGMYDAEVLTLDEVKKLTDEVRRIVDLEN